MNEQLRSLQGGETLTEDAMIEAMREIMNGRVSEPRILEFLTLLSARMPTRAELSGAARVMREKAVAIQAPYGTIDCCGTGGDLRGTWNISTAVALVAAGCGVPVAKHGNRAATSKSGAADVLEALGANLDMPIQAVEDALRKFKFTFLMAPNHHKSMKYVAAARKHIGTRTIFNLLGPLSSPAGARLQLIGVFSKDYMRLMAETLKDLGSKRVWLVHGRDGLDEITTTGPTDVVELTDEGDIVERVLTPEDFGLPTAKPEALNGGSAEDNAIALRDLLEGRKGAYRDIVLANTAAVLKIHGSAHNLPEGVKKSEDAIDSGSALDILKDYIPFSRGLLS